MDLSEFGVLLCEALGNPRKVHEFVQQNVDLIELAKGVVPAQLQMFHLLALQDEKLQRDIRRCSAQDLLSVLWHERRDIFNAVVKEGKPGMYWLELQIQSAREML